MDEKVVGSTSSQFSAHAFSAVRTSSIVLVPLLVGVILGSLYPGVFVRDSNPAGDVPSTQTPIEAQTEQVSVSFNLYENTAFGYRLRYPSTAHIRGVEAGADAVVPSAQQQQVEMYDDIVHDTYFVISGLHAKPTYSPNTELQDMDHPAYNVQYFTKEYIPGKYAITYLVEHPDMSTWIEIQALLSSSSVPDHSQHFLQGFELVSNSL